MKWVRENYCWWSVSGAAKNETCYVEDNIIKDTKMCNPELCSSLSHACSREDKVIMLCNSVRAVFVGVLFTPPSVGWRHPKPVLTLRKKSPIVRA